jgi:hypothetical protein
MLDVRGEKQRREGTRDREIEWRRRGEARGRPETGRYTPANGACRRERAVVIGNAGIDLVEVRVRHGGDQLADERIRWRVRPGRAALMPAECFGHTPPSSSELN